MPTLFQTTEGQTGNLALRTADKPEQNSITEQYNRTVDKITPNQIPEWECEIFVKGGQKLPGNFSVQKKQAQVFRAHFGIISRKFQAKISGQTSGPVAWATQAGNPSAPVRP